MQEPRHDDAAAAPTPRADARRNITAIVEAAVSCLAANPDTSIGDIARAAGVGRVTLYGHFNNRAEVVDSAFERVVTQAEQAFDTVDLAGAPGPALARLIISTWQIVDQFRCILVAAERTLSSERIRELHELPMNRVRGLIERGQQEGAFRSDQPTSWLVATFYNVLHGAADEITAGRLTDHDAPDLISTTLLAAFAAPTGRP